VVLKTISRETEETAIRIALEKTGGNLQRAALRLGVTNCATDAPSGATPGKSHKTLKAISKK